jgi:hypothetical protein
VPGHTLKFELESSYLHDWFASELILDAPAVAASLRHVWLFVDLGKIDRRQNFLVLFLDRTSV